MKIIKHGDLRRLDKTRRFTCHDCGCIWDANQTEYRHEFDRNSDVWICECPTCGRKSYDNQLLYDIIKYRQEKSPDRGLAGDVSANGQEPLIVGGKAVTLGNVAAGGLV